MTNKAEPPAPVHIYMRDEGRFLATREAGRRAAGSFRRVAGMQGDIILDFNGVEAATPPFLQELWNEVGSLILATHGAGRIVLAANLNEDLAETLTYVAARAKRGIPYVHGRKLDLLGAERPDLVRTLQEAQRLKPFFTAPELAEKLEIQPDTATQRLKRLLERGAAERQPDPEAERGVRHLYRVPDPKLAQASASPAKTALA